MLEINKALRAFWLQFGLPVFFQDLALTPFPYITYEFAVTDFAQEYAISGRLWTRDPTERVATAFPQIYWDVLEEIQNVMKPRSGILLPLDNDKGTIWLSQGTPFIIHNVPDEVRTIKSALINLNVKYYTN